MRLWIVSDLHLEFADWRPSPPDADVCVVAGDVLTRGPEHSLEWLAQHIAPAMPVVCVAGNHEFYGGRFGFDLALQRARDLRLPDVHFLDDGEAVIEGVRFLGATLWNDFELGGSDAREVAWAMMNVGGLLNDFGGAIQDFNEASGKLSTQRAKAMHERSRAFLRERLAAPFDGPTVVVTHHAPHRGSLHPRYRDSTLNAGFVSDLEGLILAGKPNLWVHGHVHDSHDYRVGSTRVVCNPRGYHGENPGFDPALVLSVPDACLSLADELDMLEEATRQVKEARAEMRSRCRRTPDADG